MTTGDIRPNEQRDIETPDGIEYRMAWFLGQGKDGRDIYAHNFQFTYAGETMPFVVIAAVDDSDQHIEDMVGEGAATMMARIMLKKQRMTAEGGKIPLNELSKEENTWHRRDFAALLRDYKASAERRRNFTSGSIYYQGITVASALPKGPTKTGIAGSS